MSSGWHDKSVWGEEEVAAMTTAAMMLRGRRMVDDAMRSGGGVADDAMRAGGNYDGK